MCDGGTDGGTDGGDAVMLDMFQTALMTDCCPESWIGDGFCRL